MGYMQHNAVIVTFSAYILENRSAADIGFDPGSVERFRDAIPKDFRSLVVGPIPSVTNGYITWMFAPDGSKEGWGPSDTGDELRRRFIELFKFAYDDGSSPFDIVEVQFGGDFGRSDGAQVVMDFPGKAPRDGMEEPHGNH